METQIRRSIDFVDKNIQIKQGQINAKRLADFLVDVREDDFPMQDAETIADRLKTIGAKNDMITAKKARLHEALSKLSAQVHEGKYVIEPLPDTFPDFEVIVKELYAGGSGGETHEQFMNTGAFCKEIIDALKVENSDLGDEDMCVVRQAQDKENEIKCPLTTTILEEPMKSKKCSHNFSKEAIMFQFKNKTIINCPVPGCGQKLKKSDLEPNPHLEKKIQRFYRQQATQQSQPDSQFDEDMTVVD